MTISEDWWSGLWTGIAIVLIAVALLSLGFCAAPDRVSYPSNGQECVVQFDSIIRCYQVEAE